MNEMKVMGYFYLPTIATTNEEALVDFTHRAREIGMNIDNITSIIVRDSNGDDITIEQTF